MGAPLQTVLDFCMGSGSTGVACAELGRRFVGIEAGTRMHRLPPAKDISSFEVARTRIGLRIVHPHTRGWAC